jgi:hypothetical protein
MVLLSPFILKAILDLSNTVICDLLEKCDHPVKMLGQQNLRDLLQLK